MELCCGLVVLLGVVAVVGHATWLLLASVLKALSGNADLLPPPQRRRHWCPGCEHELRPDDRSCPTCGLEQGSRLAAQLEHTRFAVREVAGLVDRGELDAAAAEPVTAALRARVAALSGRAPEPTRAEPVLARPLDTVPPLEVVPEPPPAEPVLARPLDAVPPLEMVPELPPDTIPVAVPVAEPVAPVEEPRRGSRLAGFMEERNIFWGELVGGLLIVGCSIALVLSLWRTLEQLPYAPFLLAAGVTAALFGAGQYTLHHWRLASTSRGLLVISLLLAPLNLLLLATPAADGGALDLGVKAVALLAFAAMARAAGRDLIGTNLLPGPIDRRWLLALAVVGAPAAVWVPAGAAAAWLPLACHAAACAAVLGGLTWYRRERAAEPLDEHAASAVLVFVGISLFALCASWGLLLTRAADVSLAVRGLAVPLVVGAVPLLEAGLLVQRRLAAGHGGQKATATGAALAGAALLATGVLMAWPDPLRLTLAAAAASALLTRVAWREGQPWFQLAAVPLLALAYVLVGLGVGGAWEPAGVTASADWTRALLVSVSAGVGYVGFALVLAAVGDYAVATGRRELGVSYALGGVAVGAVGLLLLTGHGPAAPWPAVGGHFAAAVGLLAANGRWQLRAVSQVGAALLMTGVLMAWPDPLRLTLAAAAAGVILTRVVWREGQTWFQLAAVPLLTLAFVLASLGVAGEWEGGGGATGDGTRVLLAGAAASFAYVGFALILAVVGNGVIATGRRELGLTYEYGAIAVGALGLGLAWPDPLRLTLAAGVAAVVLTQMVWRDGRLWFQLATVPLLTLAYVLAGLGAAGVWGSDIGTSADALWTQILLTSAAAGVGYVGFALVLAAVGNYAVATGRRDLGVTYEYGAIVVGVLGLLLLTGHGPTAPWPAAGAHLAAAVGLLAANVRWKQRAVAQAGVWLALPATLWALWAVRPETPGVWGVTVALEALALAAAALALTPLAARPGPRGVVFGQLRVGCRDVATGAAVLAAVLTFDGTTGRLHAGTFLALFPTSLLLARVAARSAFTWAGSAAALVGLAHLAYYTLELRPVRAALLPGALAHAWAAVLLALAFRGKRSRERLFTNPLRATARVSACVAAVLLFVPPAGLAPAWAGYAAGLAALGFAAAWVWREPGSFSPAQAALAVAAVLAGLAWVERQDWWADTALGLRDPRALRAFGVALALLGLVWVVARRLAVRSERLRELWLADPFALDRFVIGAVVVGQLLALAAAVEPAVRDELTPLVWPAPAELAHAFEPAAWLLPALLAAALLGWLRLRTPTEPGGDPALVGLILLLLTAPVLAAGAFAPQLAAASALRWGMAAAFVAGSAVVFARRPLAEAAARLGFRPGATPAAAFWSYLFLAGAAVVVVTLTADVARLGLSRLTPNGPAAETAFARIGWTWSNVVPMVLVVLGLAGTAARERLPGYAFVAGLAFTATLAGGYALGVVTAGGAFGAVENLRFVLLAVGSVAAWAALWIAAERRVPGGPLLDLQAAAGLFGVALVALVPLAQLFASPDRGLDAAFAEFGVFGGPLLAIAAWACLNRAAPHAPELRAHVAGFAGMVAGVIAACAAQPLDEPGSRLAFETLVGAWAAVGLLLTVALFRAPLLSRSSWLVGVAAALTVAALVGPGPRLRHWGSPVGLAGYALLVAAVTARLARPAVRVGYRWRRLTTAEVVAASVAGLLAVALAVGPFTLADRLGGPVAVLLLAGAAALLSRKAPFADRLRTTAVLLAAVALALTGWAAPDPTEPAVWLKRNGWAFVALVAAATACRVVPVAALRRPGGILAAAALAALAVVLLQQTLAFDPAPDIRRTPLDLTETLAILASITALTGLSLAAALRPGPDPLGLPERGRTAYVYLAELLLVLFFAHVRLNLPELFVGVLVRYWTFVVMLLAFLGVGAAEVAERRRLTVLAGPLRRTGVLLPLVPLLAFWTKPPGFVLAFADDAAPGLRPFLGYLEKLPQHFDSYAGLWFLGGLLYGLIALQRRSFGWAVLAALAANAGVWSLLEHTGVSPTVHPQVWVVPLALIVLVAEHVNRRELKPELAAGLRYVGVGLLYVSSAADMFIAGVGESLWLPVVLAVFCVAGILGGILLRVRAFLFLGAGFLLLDVFAMIWHAAVDRAQTWVWYASGIVLGAAILALFAVFEKRKNEVREVVEELRRWD